MFRLLVDSLKTQMSSLDIVRETFKFYPEETKALKKVIETIRIGSFGVKNDKDLELRTVMIASVICVFQFGRVTYPENQYAEMKFEQCWAAPNGDIHMTQTKPPLYVSNKGELHAHRSHLGIRFTETDLNVLKIHDKILQLGDIQPHGPAVFEMNFMIPVAEIVFLGEPL
jgi:hypothetical protein